MRLRRHAWAALARTAPIARDRQKNGYRPVGRNHKTVFPRLPRVRQFWYFAQIGRL